MTADTIDRIAALTEPSAILLGSGSTVEPVTIPRLAALPVIDLDGSLADPAPTEALSRRSTPERPPTQMRPSRSCARRVPRGTPRA